MSWRRIFLLAAAFLLVIAGGTWFALQRSGAATGMVRSALAKVLAAPFRLGRAHVDLLDGRLSVQEFAVADPTRPGHSLLAIDDIRLSVGADALDGSLAIHDVAVAGAHLDLDLTPGHAPRLADLLRSTNGPGQPGRGSMPDAVTPVHLTNATVNLLVSPALPMLTIRGLELHLQRTLREDGSVDERHGTLRGGARLADFGLDLALQGEVDLATGRARVQAEVVDVPIGDSLVQSILRFLGQELSLRDLGGRLGHVRIWCEANLASGEAPAFGAAFALEDVRGESDALPAPLRGVSVVGVADSRNDGTARLTATRLLPDCDTEVVVELSSLFTSPQLQLRGRGRDLPLDTTVARILRSFHAGFQVVDGLTPTAGRADLDIFLRDPGRPSELIDIDLGLEGVALSYNGFGDPATRVRFPLQVVNANGHVHLRDDVLSIEDVTAELAAEAGGGEVRMNGSVNVSHEHRDQVSIDLDVPRLTFTPALRHALGTLMHDDGALYDQFAPSGAAAVRLRVRPQGAPEGAWQVQIDALGCELSWAGFPFALREVQGKVLARDEGLQIDLQGRRGAAAVQVLGSLQAPTERPGALTSGPIDLRIRASGVPIDQELRRAVVKLSPDLDAVWLQIAPTGTAAADLAIRRPNGTAEMTYDLALQVADGTARAQALPLPIQDLRGEVFVHGVGQRIDVQVDALRGRLQAQGQRGAELAVIGTIRTHPSYAEDFTAVVRQLELDAELGRLLEQAGAMTNGTWALLRPSGRVDVICRQSRSGQAPLQGDYTVLMRDVQSQCEMLPQPATQVSGELQIRGGELAFRDVRARLGPQTIVNCSSGRVGKDADGRTEVAFTVSADRFALDDNFARLFLGPMRQAVLDRQLRGTVNIAELSLRFLLPKDGSDQPVETVLSGRAEALGVEALLGTRLQNVNGLVQLDESHVTRDGGLLRGRFTQGSARILGHDCDQATAEFEADAAECRLGKLDLRLHGGSITGRSASGSALVYRFASADGQPGRLATDLAVRGIGLNEFLRDCGMPGAPYTGTVEGWVQVHDLRGADLVDIDAEGQLEVVDGNLGPVPLFTSIYALMEERNRPRFDLFASHFRTKNRVLELSDLQLSSPLVAVRGEGSLSLDGYLYVVLTTDSFFGGNADMLVFPQVLQWVTSSILRFHLFGDLRDLRAEKRWIAQRNPRRTRLAPIPPRTAPAPRPDF